MTVATRAKPQVAIMNAVHDLPVLVARDLGFFKDEGLELEFVTTPGMAQATTSHFVKFDSVFDRPLDSVYNSGGIDQYRMCEWGIMKRAVEANAQKIRGRKIVALGAFPVTASVALGLPYPNQVNDDLVLSAAWDAAVARWRTLPSDAGAKFDKEVDIDVASLRPMITFGTNPGMVMPIDDAVPEGNDAAFRKALAYMQIESGKPLLGLPVDVVAGGSTGTHDIDVELAGLTELQSGSYCVMDVDYRRIGGRRADAFTEFEMALTVLATVVSVPTADRAMVDAGLKAFSTDKPFPPEPVERPGVEYGFAGDEHGRLTVVDRERPVRLGEQIEFLPPHCDPTFNLYDRVWCVRGGKVEAVWDIAARGRSD